MFCKSVGLYYLASYECFIVDRGSKYFFGFYNSILPIRRYNDGLKELEITLVL